jgi:hypothetical protein
MSVRMLVHPTAPRSTLQYQAGGVGLLTIIAGGEGKLEEEEQIVRPCGRPVCRLAAPGPVNEAGWGGGGGGGRAPAKSMTS